MGDMHDALKNSRHRRFIDEYMVDRCGAAAARRAGYSEKRAKVTASELLNLPEHRDIQAAIAEREKEQAQEAADRAARVAAELEKIAFMNLGEKPENWRPGLGNLKRAALLDLLKLSGQSTQPHEQNVGLRHEDWLKLLK